MQLLRDDMIDRLQAFVGPAEVAADALHVCPIASGFGFADLVIINYICTSCSLKELTVNCFLLRTSVPHTAL